jgi:hypothetical protein
MFGTKPQVTVDVQREPEGVGGSPGGRVGGPYAVLTDERSTAVAIRDLIRRSGVPSLRVAHRMGVNVATLQKYVNLPGVHKQWRTASIKQLARIAAICGGRVILEFPREPLE